MSVAGSKARFLPSSVLTLMPPMRRVSPPIAKNLGNSPFSTESSPDQKNTLPF